MRAYTPVVFDMEWAAPPPEPTPDGMIYCKVLGQNIPVCGMAASCTVRSCAAREVNNDN